MKLKYEKNIYKIKKYNKKFKLIIPNKQIKI